MNPPYEYCHHRALAFVGLHKCLRVSIKVHMEPKLLRVVHYLLTISAFKRGYIVDSGANDGSSSVVLATMFPEHIVWAIEPLKSNVIAIHNKVKTHNATNMKVLRGGLGDVDGFRQLPVEVGQAGRIY